MSSIQGSIHSNMLTSLNDLSRDFKEADSGKFLRGDTKFPILHTTSTVGGAINGFLAKIGLGNHHAKQVFEREKGAEMVKDLINSEFREPGLADKLFDKIKEKTGRDLNLGVTVGDLAKLRDLAKVMNAGNNVYEKATEPEEKFVYRPQGDSSNSGRVLNTPMINIPDDDIKLAGEVGSLLNRPIADSNAPTIEDKFNDLTFKVLERKANELTSEIDDFMEKHGIKEDDELNGLMEVIDNIETEPREIAELFGPVDIDNMTSDDILNMISEVESDRKDGKIPETKAEPYIPVMDWAEMTKTDKN